MSSRIYDVAIIGGGVSGTSVAYVFSRFTNIQSIVVIEEEDDWAEVNSNSTNNSQTLHWGDIETNYDLAHALPIQDAAQLMMNYVLAHPDERGLYQVTNKMVLGVGAEEVATLRKRFEDFRKDFPALRLIEADEIRELEPAVMEGRDPNQPVVALLSTDGYAINYKLLSVSFMDEALASDKIVDAYVSTRVENKGIVRKDDGTYVIKANKGEIRAKTIVVCAGPQSLLFAQQMGYVPELGFLPVAGSFYRTKKPLLNGKVYTVQMEGLPFAAVHGDPDVAVEGITRFGPTAKVIPMLKRHRYGTAWKFLSMPVLRHIATPLTLLTIARNLVLTKFIAKNFFYDWRILGKRLYLRQMRKIVPTLELDDVTLGKKLGGIRPQIFDTKTRQLQMGESKIFGTHGDIYNTTPSPGASVSLMNAEKDVKFIIGYLGDGYVFDQAAFNRELRSAPAEEDASA